MSTRLSRVSLNRVAEGGIHVILSILPFPFQHDMVTSINILGTLFLKLFHTHLLYIFIHLWYSSIYFDFNK